jgi:hypothetical protein
MDTSRVAADRTEPGHDGPGSNRPFGIQSTAIMQPYFIPYLGYFQLIAAVGTFVIYDDVQYIQRGWINRNRLLNQGQPQYVTIPLSKASQNKRICDLSIAQTGQWQKKTLHTIRAAYGRAPHFTEVLPLCETIVGHAEPGLVGFLEHSLTQLCSALGISTRFVRASNLPAVDQFRGAARILAICKQLGATTYINPIGGTALYSPGDFLQEGIRLQFLKSAPPKYRQHAGNHVPSLSIIDVLMFNGVAQTREWLSCYQLVSSDSAELPAGRVAA